MQWSSVYRDEGLVSLLLDDNGGGETGSALMKSSAIHSFESAAIAEYLADREGLRGAARGHFLRLLCESLGYRRTARRRNAWAVGGAALGVAALGLLIEILRGARWESVSVFAWLGFAVLGATLAVVLARAERRTGTEDREIEWRVYCLLLRPVILAERPGLLDRNLLADRGARERLDIPPRQMVATILRERRTDLWGPGAVGWCIGLVALISWRVAVGPEVWTFALPLMGFVLGPVAWAYWRIAVYLRVERAARLAEDKSL